MQFRLLLNFSGQDSYHKYDVQAWLKIGVVFLNKEEVQSLAANDLSL